MNKRLFTALLVLISGWATAQTRNWTLAECLAYAEKNNLSIKQSAADIQLAQAARTRALGQFLPSIAGFASQDFNIGFSINPITNAYQNQTTKSNTLGAGLSVPLFTGGENLANTRRASLEVLGRQYQLQQLTNDIKI